MNRPSIQCGHCDGSGCVPLPDTLWRTLQLVHEHGQLTPPELKRIDRTLDDCSETSANNRLQKLWALGFLARFKVGGRGGVRAYAIASETAPRAMAPDDDGDTERRQTK